MLACILPGVPAWAGAAAINGARNVVRACAGPPAAPDYEADGTMVIHGDPAYRPGTCECLAGRLGWHLKPALEKGGCVFETPPLRFDPSRAAKAELEAWGIPKDDAPALQNLAQREVYFTYMKHVAAGEHCDRRRCGPGVITSVASLDSPMCAIPPNPFIHYCIAQGPKPKPADVGAE